MDELNAMLQPLSVDQLILMMTATLRESIRLGGDAEHRVLALILGRELFHRKIDPLPFMAAALLLDVPE